MKVKIPCKVSIPLCEDLESMLEIVLFLRELGKVQETEVGVLTTQFWQTDAISSQHSYFWL